ncbi:hypothetical protein VMCG_09826 [Cytospora schulzeri]|uniref:Uncharacterized protein n=1 Tax=Cytospora schulzeri TaxID=448051 RepID=A0A423VHZ4_9PEZI|nr:hypothetical protein VMCG_09826 [Valsa malicola]
MVDPWLPLVPKVLERTVSLKAMVDPWVQEPTSVNDYRFQGFLTLSLTHISFSKDICNVRECCGRRSGTGVRDSGDHVLVVKKTSSELIRKTESPI